MSNNWSHIKLLKMYAGIYNSGGKPIMDWCVPVWIFTHSYLCVIKELVLFITFPIRRRSMMGTGNRNPLTDFRHGNVILKCEIICPFGCNNNMMCKSSFNVKIGNYPRDLWFLIKIFQTIWFKLSFQSHLLRKYTYKQKINNNQTNNWLWFKTMYCPSKSNALSASKRNT